MKKCVAFVSTDSSIITNPKGQSNKRQSQYSRYFQRLVIVVLNLKSNPLKSRITKKYAVIPTNSISRWHYIQDALNILEKNKPYDVVSAQSPFIEGVVGVISKLLWGTKLNIQLHIDLYNTSHFRYESLQNFLFYLLSFVTIFLSDTVRVGSKRLMCGPKVFRAVVPMRLKLFWHKPRKRSYNQIISVARLVKQKNFPLFIDVAEKIIAEHPKMKFLIVGSGPEESKIRKLIDKKRMSKKIKIVGWKTQLQYKKLFLKSDLYLSTSNYEGWGMSQTEALASGLPIVTTDTGCAGDLIINGKIGGLVRKQNDVKGLVNGALLLLQNKELTRRLVLEGQKKLKKDFEEKKLISIFANLLLRNNNKS